MLIYLFMAVLADTANYLGATSNCEPFTVDKKQLSISTTIHTDSPDAVLFGNLQLDGAVPDSAAVTGKVDAFTLPEVTFYIFDFFSHHP